MSEVPGRNLESIKQQWLPESPTLMHCALESKSALSCPGVSARINTSKRCKIRYLELALLPILFPSSLYPMYKPQSPFTIYSQAHRDFYRHSQPKCSTFINEAATLQTAEHARLLAVTITLWMHHLLLSWCDWLPTFHGTFPFAG